MKRPQLRKILIDKYDIHISEIVNEIKNLDPSLKLNGDDSDLADVWEEFAFQIQVEQSFYFEVYEEVIFQIIDDLLKSIDEIEIKLLWLYTDHYFELNDDELDENGFPPLYEMREAVSRKIFSGVTHRADMEDLYSEDEDEDEDDEE